MPRSGYDRTNCTSLEEKQGNTRRCQTSAGTSKTDAESRRVPRSCTIPSTDPNEPSSALRTPLIPNAPTCRPSSKKPSAAGSSAHSPPSPFTLPLQEHSTNAKTAFGSAQNSTTSSISPLPRVRADRTALPTVRVSPGYVEHTGSYRVFNNNTGRGWRYSEPAVRAANSLGPGMVIILRLYGISC